MLKLFTLVGEGCLPVTSTEELGLYTGAAGERLVLPGLGPVGI